MKDKDVHIILRATDDGIPELTLYKKAIPINME